MDLVAYGALWFICMRLLFTGRMELGALGLIALVLYERINKVYIELFKEETEEKVKILVRQNYWKGQ